MYDLKDKVALVTGGAAGIGAGVVRAFLEEGAKALLAMVLSCYGCTRCMEAGNIEFLDGSSLFCNLSLLPFDRAHEALLGSHVAFLDVDVSSGNALEKDLIAEYGINKAKFYKCDVTTKELDDAYNSIVQQFNYIDVVVNSAGIMNDSPKVYEKALAVNVTALITSSMRAYNLMRKDRGGKGGAVINIASIAALFQCSALPIYCAAKSAVMQFSTALGMDPHYSRSGVRLITICFGATDTSLLHSTKYAMIDKESDEDDLVAESMKYMALQRPESAVRGLVEAYKRGASASTWLVTNDEPAEDITNNVTKAYEIMSQGVFLDH